MNDTKAQIMDVLRRAYQIEVDGYSFYSMVADKATRPAVQEMFEKLANDEVQHKAYLRDVARSYEAMGASAFAFERRNPEFKALSQAIFNDEFRKQAEGASFELSSLSIGMQLESNAIAHFGAAARTATDREVREFYQFLMDWERQHMDALQRLYEGVRTDFWADGGFSPF